MRANHRRFTSPSGSVTFRVAGEGPALVLLHGFLCDSRVWATQLALSDRFTVIAWDAPGAGESSDPSEPFSIDDWADELAALLDETRTDIAHVLGLSWGGLLAQAFYAAYPARVSSLILADTYAGWRGSFGAEIAEDRFARCVHDLTLPIDRFLARWVPQFFTSSAPRSLLDEMDAIVSDRHPQGFRLMARALADADTRDVLASIDVPTLLLWGADDVRSPLSVARAMHHLVPNARLEVIADAGHIANMECPEAFNDLVADFCLSLDGGG